MPDREWGIPDDLVRHDEVYAANAAPQLWDLDMYEIHKAWDMGITGKGVRVSINDTGGDENHPDIPTAVARRSFVGGDTGDRNAHGTWCIGRVLGRNGVGIAPEAELIVAKVLSDNGSGSTRGINEARVWAAKEGADVLSESLGGPGGSREDIDSIEEATELGVQLDVAAAGNSGYRGSNTIGYPGRYLETFCVGSHDSRKVISSFSSGGRELDIATPGENVISTRPGGGYQGMSGTSMATPFFAGLMALIIHKRRIAGHADLHGADKWREFFDQQGFYEDAGEPGKDVRYGLGFPLIHNILDWLVDPKWFVFLFCLLGLSGVASAQSTQDSTVSNAQTLHAESATVTETGDGVRVIAEGVRGTVSPSVIVTTDIEDPLVRAYPKANPFPPIPLVALGGNKWLLEGPSGAAYTVEILGKIGGQWKTDYLEATIGAQPPPVDPPTDPVEPPPTDGRDWSEIQTWISNHQTPTTDKTTANKWSAELEKVLADFPIDLIEASERVEEARRDVFTHRDANTDWSPFFAALSDKLGPAPETTDEYRGFVTALAKGLKR